MSIVESTNKVFEPGTTGWTAADLDDRHIEQLWFQGRYEIVDGVLTSIPPAYFAGGRSLFVLMTQVAMHQKQHGISGDFSIEVDIIINEDRVAIADAVWMTSQELGLQTDAAQSAKRKDPNRTRILVPPSLVIESVSPGNERHDRNIKRRWYAEFGVPNYWLLDAFGKSLECLVLEEKEYKTELSGKNKDKIQSPRLFPGLIIDLAEVWGR